MNNITTLDGENVYEESKILQILERELTNRWPFYCNAQHLMYRAVVSHFWSLFKYLVEKNYNFRFSNEVILKHLCMIGNLELVKYVIERGADYHIKYMDPVDYNTKDLSDAVMHAGMNGKIHILEYLENLGANIGLHNENWMFVIHEAIVRGSDKAKDTIQFYEKRGADIQKGNKQYFAEACFRGHLDLVKYFFDFKNLTEDSLFLGLNNAAKMNHLDVVKFLYEQGVNVHANEDEAMRKAVSFGSFKTIVFLLAKGANIRAKNDEAIKHINRWLLFAPWLDLGLYLYGMLYEADETIFAKYNYLPDRFVKIVKLMVRIHQRKKVWAVNTIVNWWIPICYDPKRECGKRMAEKSWNRVQGWLKEV